MPKPLYYIAMIAIVVAISVVLLFVFTLTYPFKIIEIYNQPYAVLNSPLYPGEELALSVSFCKFKDTHGVANHILVGDRSIYLPATQADIAKGCYEFKSLNTIIPTETPSGEYRLYNIVDYEVYPWRKIRYTSVSEPFIVLELPE